MFATALMLLLATTAPPLCAAPAADTPAAEVRGLLQGEWFTGVVERGRRRTLVAAARGEIANTAARVGRRVAAGEVLVVLHSPDATAALDAATSEELESRAAIAAARANGARIERQLARRDAHPQLFAVEERESLRHEAAGAQAAIEQAQARHELAALHLRRARELAQSLALRAPAPGIVVSVPAGDGTHVEQGQPLVELQYGEELVVRFAVPATGVIATGMPVCAWLTDGTTLYATVHELADAADARLDGRIAIATVATAATLDDVATGMVARVAATTAAAHANR